MPAAAAKQNLSLVQIAQRKKSSVIPMKEAIERHRRNTAKQAEEACHIAGNINGPDLDEFEEKLHLCDFA